MKNKKVLLALSVIALLGSTSMVSNTFANNISVPSSVMCDNYHSMLVPGVDVSFQSFVEDQVILYLNPNTKTPDYTPDNWTYTPKEIDAMKKIAEIFDKRLFVSDWGKWMINLNCYSNPSTLDKAKELVELNGEWANLFTKLALDEYIYKILGIYLADGKTKLIEYIKKNPDSLQDLKEWIKDYKRINQIIKEAKSLVE